MKKINFILALLIIALNFFFTACEEEDNNFNLGATQKNFVKDVTYQTTTDGFLLVQVAMTELGAIIYAGVNENPTDTIGVIEPFGSLTLPLQKDTYWKVTTYGDQSLIEKLVIEWTPVN